MIDELETKQLCKHQSQGTGNSEPAPPSYLFSLHESTAAATKLL